MPYNFIGLKQKHIYDVPISYTSNLYQVFPEDTIVDKEDLSNVIHGNNVRVESAILFGETEEPP